MCSELWWQMPPATASLDRWTDRHGFVGAFKLMLAIGVPHAHLLELLITSLL